VSCVSCRDAQYSLMPCFQYPMLVRVYYTYCIATVLWQCSKINRNFDLANTRASRRQRCGTGERGGRATSNPSHVVRPSKTNASQIRTAVPPNDSTVARLITARGHARPKRRHCEMNSDERSWDRPSKVPMAPSIPRPSKRSVPQSRLAGCDVRHKDDRRQTDHPVR
jgi:hypothetical protein